MSQFRSGRIGIPTERNIQIPATAEMSKAKSRRVSDNNQKEEKMTR